jgi:XTP/dITP diphosphohydrolase
MKLVLASANAGKLRELRDLLAPLGHELLALSDFGIAAPEETGTSFVENAVLKARHAAAIARLPALADDSGIEVAALQGRPGVYSARYAGNDASDQQNVQKMLQELSQVPTVQRQARYCCVIAYLESAQDSAPRVASGFWNGSILFEPRGGGGFGYDPIFQPEGMTCSAAELSAEHKNRLSHRAQALRQLQQLLL